MGFFKVSLSTVVLIIPILGFLYLGLIISESILSNVNSYILGIFVGFVYVGYFSVLRNYRKLFLKEYGAQPQAKRKA